VVGLGLFAAACGGSNKVGDKSLLNIKDQLPQGQLGARTTTTIAVTTTAQPASLGIKPATTKAPTATTVAREQVILIYGDQNATGQFSPNAATVFTNYTVRFQNNDTVARTVVFTGKDTRRSPVINPGQSWPTTFTTPGTYNYQDRTRPYAVGSITVVAR
jgi:plastocyanin